MEVYRPISSYIKSIDKCNPSTPTSEWYECVINKVYFVNRETADIECWFFCNILCIWNINGYSSMVFSQLFIMSITNAYLEHVLVNKKWPGMFTRKNKVMSRIVNQFFLIIIWEQTRFYLWLLCELIHLWTRNMQPEWWDWFLGPHSGCSKELGSFSIGLEFSHPDKQKTKYPAKIAKKTS